MGHSDIHKVLHGMFNDRDFDAMDAHLDTTFAYADVPRGLTLHDAAEFKDWLRVWTTAFSGARIDAAQYLGGSDFSVSLFRGTGRNDGPFGYLPPTNQAMDVPYCEVMRHGSDGKVLSCRIFYDQVTLLNQLGHITPPGDT